MGFVCTCRVYTCTQGVLCYVNACEDVEGPPQVIKGVPLLSKQWTAVLKKGGFFNFKYLGLTFVNSKAWKGKLTSIFFP